MYIYIYIYICTNINIYVYVYIYIYIYIYINYLLKNVFVVFLPLFIFCYRFNMVLYSFLSFFICYL